jgi:lipoprotein-anchoring transpeptidase ErfK/SrfK
MQKVSLTLEARMPGLRLSLFATAAFLIAVLPATADVVITIDKSAQRMIVVVDGATRWNWPVSTGARRFDTPNGRYAAFRMEKDHYSKEWDDAPMPNSIFFTQRGHAFTAVMPSAWGGRFRMVVCG